MSSVVVVASSSRRCPGEAEVGREISGRTGSVVRGGGGPNVVDNDDCRGGGGGTTTTAAAAAAVVATWTPSGPSVVVHRAPP